MTINEAAWGWLYPFTAAAGLLLALLLPSARKQVAPAQRAAYFYLQVITIVGAVVGAKLAMLAGDLGWPGAGVSLHQALFSGKSLVGGLLGGFVAAEAAKPWFGYTEPPNDWFAAKVVLSIAVGRVGCLVAGCCRGLPTSSPVALIYSDGVPRVPVAAIEILLHAALFVVFVALYRRGRQRGRLFALYMMSYGVARIALEPLRDTPKPLGGWSVYQLLCVLLIAGGAWSFQRRLRPAPQRVTA